MLQDTRIPLFLLAELAAVLRANDPDLFKRWLYGGIEDLGEPAVTELLLDLLDLFTTRVESERDKIVTWHLGVSHWAVEEWVLSKSREISTNTNYWFVFFQTWHLNVAS